MDFSLTSEQQLLQESAARFAVKGCGFEQYKRSLKKVGQADPAVWSGMAELGWLALPIPESLGGIGGSAIDVCLISEALGAGMVIEPFVTGVVAPARALATAGEEQQPLAVLQRVASGELHLALAYSERGAPFDPLNCKTIAHREPGGFRLSGDKHCVFNAPNAETLVVSARTSGTSGQPEGLALFLVDSLAAGVEMTGYPTLGGGVAADVRLRDVSVPFDGCFLLAPGSTALDDALDLATVASCAQALGAMQALVARTTAYVQTRKQFGVPIGTFQVIQHRLAEMAIELEQARSMVIMSASKIDSAPYPERRRAVSATKIYLGKASKMVAQQAVQLHGGIGVTEELDVGHYFRQLTAFGTKFGDRNFHFGRFELLADRAGIS